MTNRQARDGSVVKIAINMLWCVPGRVGGSEEYFVRQLTGLNEIAAPFRHHRVRATWL